MARQEVARKEVFMRSAETAETIKPGTVLGGRITVDRFIHTSAVSQVYLASDNKTHRGVALRVLSKTVIESDESFDILRDATNEAAKIKHPNVVATYGVGSYGSNTRFTACEWVDGSSLADFVASRKEAGQNISVRGIYNLVTHICKALDEVHQTTFHGALRPSSVWITKSGRVKVGDFGLGLTLVKTGKWKLLAEPEQAFFAPEIKLGKVPDKRSDIFGIGAILYVLLTGRSPVEQFVPPSTVHPDATPELDRILLKCLAVDPADRYARPEELSRSLLPLVAETPEPQTTDFDIDIEIDVDVAASLPPPRSEKAVRDTTANRTLGVKVQSSPAAIPAQAAVPPRTASSPRLTPISPTPGPAPTGRISPTPEPRAAETPKTGRASEPEVRARQSEVDLEGLLKRVTENDAPRWMVQKDRLDHGPFSGRELVQMIVKGEVAGDNGLLNMDTGERKEVREYPEFTHFLEQHRMIRAEQEEKAALERSSKVEKRSNAATFIILASAISVLVLAGLGYLLSRRAAREERARDVDLANLFESGQVKIVGNAGILTYKPTARRAGARSSTSPGGFSSYEDAMNQAMSLGDATRGGGERQLTSGDVAGVMNRKLNSLFGCVSQALRQGQRLGTVKIDLAIAGSGNIMGATVNAGNNDFKRCIVGMVKQIKFPTFPAPRMGARYSFDVD
jgi:eukaryotic-like serine/threonine-protein kinase